LQHLLNVGPAVAGDLLRLGITAPAALAGQDPEALYEPLCALDGVRHAPCLLDVFTSIVAPAKGEPAQLWWVFSRQRKARDQGCARARPVATGSGRSVQGS
jgi:hypothetical protein